MKKFRNRYPSKFIQTLLQLFPPKAPSATALLKLRMCLMLPVLLLTSHVAEAQDWNPQPSWTDSYAANGFCWCESNFDHGLSGKTVEINGTDYSVEDICDELKQHPLYRAMQNGDPRYNDIQCGNGPANNAADEAGCPGRVDQGPGGCNEIGPNWDMNWLASRTRFGGSGTNSDVDMDGELRKWHKITLTFDGPQSSETASPNPFSDYRLEVTFTNGNSSYTVPGYFAACGNAAENSCDSGNKWRVHFAPDKTGTWNYEVVFKTGNDVAINGGGSSAGFMDGATGSFSVANSNKSGRDHRAKGRLQYVGQHYLQYAETGEWFVKGGADAPENTLAYDDFDDVPNRSNRRKSWSPHQQDYVASDAGDYTWKNGKGSELLGAINYLSGKGMNALSFLTFSLSGDDENVFPHRLKVGVNTYNGYGDSEQWNSGVYHDRFDVSRMDQWEKIFEYADKKGVYLHFKTQETENDQRMDGGNVGRERKLYYRELVARYAHHLALNWNTGEENSQNTAQERAMADYLSDIDPYGHNIVMHTYPGQKDKYDDLIGNQSDYTGASLQSGITAVHGDVVTWVNKSRNSGKRWIVANDEQGGANTGVDVDPDDRKKVREEVIWGTLMGGGAGFEFYYGYQTGCSDLTCEDHRTRDQKYTDAAYALQFFQTYFQPYLPDIRPDDGATNDGNDFVLRNASNTAYAVYRPNGGSTNINLPNGDWTLSWYNPRNGNMGNPTNFNGGQLSAPNNDDWVAFITSGQTDATDPIVYITEPTGGTFFETGADIQVTASASDPDGNITKVQFYNGSTLLGEDTDAPFTYTISNAAEGTYTLTAKATDNDDNTTTSAEVSVQVTNDPPAGDAVVNFTLYNSETNQAIPGFNPLTDGAVINLADVGDKLNITANTSPATVGSVEFKLNGSQYAVENVLPYALQGDSNGDFDDWSPGVGTYTLTATPYSGSNEGGTQGTPLTITFEVIDNDQPDDSTSPTINITQPTNGSTFVEGNDIEIKANASDSDGTVTKVEFYRGSNKIGEDTNAPYTQMLSNVEPGNYELMAMAFDNDGNTSSSTVSVEVFDQITPGGCDEYEEKDGVVIFEAENLDPPSPWQIRNDNAATGNKYIIWTGNNQYNSRGNGEMVVKFKINQTGRYRFMWRMRQSSGYRSDEANDSWVDFPDARFFGINNGTEKEFSNYIKIFGNARNSFGWSARGDVNHVKYSVYVEFDQPGTYTMRLSGRSKGHQLDRIALFHSSVNQSTATDLNNPETTCDDNDDNPCAGNAAPSVDFSTPANNATFEAGTDIALEATASDSDGTITKVEFYQDGQKIGEENNAPYEHTIQNAAAGTYTIEVKATDNCGATASETITITVNEGQTDDPVAPTVSITSPNDGDTFTEGTDIEIMAEAADSDGMVTKVEFYEGTTKIGEDTDAPYAYTIMNATPGNYELTAKAIDDEGNTKMSGAVAIEVTEAVDPSADAVVSFTLYNSETDEEISSLEDGAVVNLATVGNKLNIVANTNPNPVGSVQFTLNGNDAGVENVVPYALAGDSNGDFNDWMPEVGTYTLMATPYAESNTSGAMGTPLTIMFEVIDDEQPDDPTVPTVAITQPTNGSTFIEGSNIEIKADATDDNMVMKVEFYQNGNKVGEDTEAPYTHMLSSVEAGNYELMAKATDDEGNTSSSTVSVQVYEQYTPGCDEYEEKDGMVIFEAENLDPPAPWRTVNDNSATGNQYIIWEGGNQYNTRGNGEMIVKFKINQTGRYKFMWRMRQSTNGYRSDEANDSWVDFPDARFFGINNGTEKVFNNYIKVFGNARNGFGWSARGDVNHDKYTVYVEFDQPGTYTMRLSGRSNGHQLDRIVLFHSSVNQSTATNTSNSETTCADGEDDPCALNEAPSVEMTTPTNNAVFEVGTDISLSATATDTDGTIEKVEFYQDGQKIGEESSAPYEHTITGAAAGTYTIEVKATDDCGATASETISITVEDEQSDDPCVGNVAPTIAFLEPMNNATYEVGEQVLIKADASDSDGTVEKVEFFHDESFIWESVSNPYQFQIAFNQEGTVNLIAVVTDDCGETAKVSVQITIGSDNGGEVVTGSNCFAPAQDAYMEDGNTHDRSNIRIEEGRRVAYLQYNLNMGTDPIAGASLDFSVATDPGYGTIKVYLGDDNSWTEGSLSPANAPEAGVELGSLKKDFEENQRYSIPLDIAQLPTSGTVSLVLMMEPNGNDFDFASQEHGNLPPAELCFAYANVDCVPSMEDAYLQDGSRYDATNLRIESDRRVVYMQFDMSEITATVANAALQLQVASDPGDGTIKVYKGDHDDWTEDNLSDDNRPLPGTELGSLEGAFSVGETVAIPLNTSLMMTDEPLTLVLMMESGNDIDFASKEHDLLAGPSLCMELESTNESSTQQLYSDKDDLGQAHAPKHAPNKQGEMTVEIFPNPFVHAAQVRLFLPESGTVQLQLLDTQGRTVKQWETIDAPQGWQNIPLQATTLAQGMYYLTVKTKTETTTKRVVVVNN